MISVKCAHCGSSILKENGAYNKAIKAGLRLFCDKICSGMGRRKIQSDRQKKNRVRDYGMVYRKNNKKRIKEKKASYFKETYDPEKASKERKTPEYREKHNAYLQQPKWVKYKKDYDKEYLAKKLGGKYWESLILCRKIEDEFRKQVPDKYERMKLKGVIARQMSKSSLKRKRLSLAKLK